MATGLNVREKAEIAKDFKSAVTELEQNLRNIANGETVVVGTDEKPIVSDSKLVPIRHFFMDGFT